MCMVRAVNTSSRRSMFLAASLVATASCSGGSKKGPDPVLGDDQQHVGDTKPNPDQGKPDPTSARDHARAEVARLKAIADQDPMLAPWTGDYGGVPPWDQIAPDKFPKAFETGLALLLAEVDV